MAIWQTLMWSNIDQFAFGGQKHLDNTTIEKLNQNTINVRISANIETAPGDKNNSDSPKQFTMRTERCNWMNFSENEVEKENERINFKSTLFINILSTKK